jgi:predicted Zn-dependent protease
MISVISDWVLATVRAGGLGVWVELILRLLRSRPLQWNWPARRNWARLQFQFRQSRPITQIGDAQNLWPDKDKMDKIAGLKEILELDANNSFARYGLAMELANRGETAAALGEFDTLLANDPVYTAGYFMSAQTLVKAGRTAEAIDRLKAGIGCAARSGNSHAVSELQAMLDELDG